MLIYPRIRPLDKFESRLLPNQYRRENFFKAGVTYRIPSSQDRFRLKVGPPMVPTLLLSTRAKPKLTAPPFSTLMMVAVRFTLCVGTDSMRQIRLSLLE